jgi:hypothetical protein
MPTCINSWLKAVEYYSLYFSQFSEVVKDFDPKDSAFIGELQELLSKPQLKNDIAYIQLNFNCLSKAIIELEKSQISLNDSLNAINSVIDHMKNA